MTPRKLEALKGWKNAVVNLRKMEGECLALMRNEATLPEHMLKAHTAYKDAVGRMLDVQQKLHAEFGTKGFTLNDIRGGEGNEKQNGV